MAGILPDSVSGGLVIRDAAGNCTTPPNVVNSYCPPAAFITSCEVTALPSDCTARITPAQINAIVSELMSLAECWDPDGPWDCASVTNLCSAFNAWAALNISGVIISDTAPPAPKHGLLWYESDTGSTHIYYDDGNSAQWVQIAPGSGGGGSNVDLTAYVLKAGDVMTGALHLAGLPVAITEAVNKQYVDTSFVLKAGDTMAGPLNQPLMPINPNELTNKAYVDSLGGIPPGGLPGEAFVVSATNVPTWGAPIDCGTF